MPTKTLVCTVGGTRAPVLASIRTHAPDRVVFVCSMDDEATGARGSQAEITKNPSLPTEARLADGTWETILVPADDPNATFAAVAARLAQAAQQGECFADYTAGTKSMSAALFMAACQTPDVRVSLVSGLRPDLARVLPGTERMRIVPSGSIQKRRLEEQVASCWERYAYAEAELLVRSAVPDVLDATTDRWRTLSHAYARWDAWDHPSALELLKNFGTHAGAFLPTIRVLAAPSSRAADALRVADMLMSTERRARGHQFDAAVLRLYRVFEWIAQWTLKWDHEIDTSAVPEGHAVSFLTHVAPTGKRVLACDAAWKAVAALDGPLSDVAQSLGNQVLGLALKRNESVLAHGQRVLDHADYKSCRGALLTQVWPAFLKLANVREVQLPTVLP